MTIYEELLDDIDSSDIKLVYDKSTQIPAVSFSNANGDYIFLNEYSFETNAERFVALAHEKGHCDSGAFYNIHTPLITREICEHRAWRRAILDQLPFDKLMEAFEICKTEDGISIYDLANYLDMPPDFIKMAIEQYIKLGKQIL